MKKKEIYQLPAEGKMHEVTEEQYREYYHHQRYEKYQDERIQENHVYHYSNLDTDEILGEELFSYPDEVSIEDQVFTKILLRSLYRQVLELPEKDKNLILAIYYKKISIREYANQLGVSHTAVEKRIKRVLKRIKKKMNI